MVSEPYFGASRKSQQSTVQPAAGTLPLDQAPDATPHTNAHKRKRTRKKAVQPSTAVDIAAVESYSQIREWLFLAYESLVSAPGGFPLDVDGRVSTESGQAAAPAQDTVEELDFIKFRELADISGSAKYSLPDDEEADADSNQYPILTVDDLSEDVSDIFNTVVSNPSTGCKTMSLFGHSYIIPAQSSFIMSDLAKAPRLLNTLDPFDLIVMDPPWPNKSVRRAGQYGDIDVYDLFQIPLKNLLASGGYVAVWVTNKLKFHKFVREKLFPSWGVQWVSEWYWIKVTTKGQWVIDPDSVHRKPYEVLIIGRSPSSLDEHPIPEKRAICTVPSKQHSRKPFLDDVLAPYLPSNPRKLELFARNLLPKWTSWGNQVLKFNDVQYLSQK
ncbi:MT-A70-domain-containing protein [Powellomyces hirtus]|nr:MT-A70-domain-containing protein [Powellomyces hirtus]KAI8915270.1 MT-A70-domain-containing protein [Powellomyces hirtus]